MTTMEKDEKRWNDMIEEIRSLCQETYAFARSLSHSSKRNTIIAAYAMLREVLTEMETYQLITDSAINDATVKLMSEIQLVAQKARAEKMQMQATNAKGGEA